MGIKDVDDGKRENGTKKSKEQRVGANTKGHEILGQCKCKGGCCEKVDGEWRGGKIKQGTVIESWK